MISVPELDIYLKAFFYFMNADSGLYSTIVFSEGLRSWIRFINNNSGMLGSFRETVERPEFGFEFNVARTTSMFGEREFQDVADPFLILPAQYLKMYLRLLYSKGFLRQPEEFASFRYYLRYLPKTIVNVYKWDPETSEYIAIPNHYWIRGGHAAGDEQSISYNVAVRVEVATIIEEELHAHGRPVVGETVEKIRGSEPGLIEEIEENLNLVLSAEGWRFRELGEALRRENSSELRNLEQFVDLFEREAIESTRIRLLEEEGG
jgi:hypothetical protein